MEAECYQTKLVVSDGAVVYILIILWDELATEACVDFVQLFWRFAKLARSCRSILTDAGINGYPLPKASGNGIPDRPSQSLLDLFLIRDWQNQSPNMMCFLGYIENMGKVCILGLKFLGCETIYKLYSARTGCSVKLTMYSGPKWLILRRSWNAF